MLVLCPHNSVACVLSSMPNMFQKMTQNSAMMSHEESTEAIEHVETWRNMFWWDVRCSWPLLLI